MSLFDKICRALIKMIRKKPEYKKLWQNASPTSTFNPQALSLDGLAAVSYTHLDVYKRQLFMQAVIADRLGMICYALSEKSAEKPVSLVNLLLGKVEMEDVRKDVVTFDTPEEFENAWKGGTE